MGSVELKTLICWEPGSAETPISCLADEVLLAVFHQLDFRSVLQCRAVSRRWRCIGDDKSFNWTHLFARTFGMQPLQGVSTFALGAELAQGTVFLGDYQRTEMYTGHTIRCAVFDQKSRSLIFAGNRQRIYVCDWAPHSHRKTTEFLMPKRSFGANFCTSLSLNSIGDTLISKNGRKAICRNLATGERRGSRDLLAPSISPANKSQDSLTGIMCIHQPVDFYDGTRYAIRRYAYSSETRKWECMRKPIRLKKCASRIYAHAGLLFAVCNFNFSGHHIKMWDVASGEFLHKFSTRFGMARVTRLAFTGPIMFSGHEDGKVRLWNIRDKKRIRTIDLGYKITDLSTTATTLTAVIYDHNVMLLDFSESLQKTFTLS